jgi:ABC-2 type transport system permease protein
MLKILIIVLFSSGFWYSLFKLFTLGLNFIHETSDTLLTPILVGALRDSIFYFFFFCLVLMLVISNSIISYISFFKSRESGFLMTLPVSFENFFLYRMIESLVFSSWAFVFLATPLLGAMGSCYGLGIDFYIFAGASLVIFILWPALIGGCIALIVTIVFPRSIKMLLILLGAILLAGGLIIISKLAILRGALGVDIQLAQEVLDSFGFARNPLLPSYWVARGILLCCDGQTSEALFYLGLILSNVLFAAALIYILATRLVPKGWFISQGITRAKRPSMSFLWDKLIYRTIFFINHRIRRVIIKDAKSFVRDPVQWTQFLIFFGLLALYFLNLRTFSYQERDITWRHIVAQMNLAATALTLSTFTSRFVFPQLSLEGRRFWIIGMAPLKRDRILTSKLILSILFSLIISQTLLTISSVMLVTPLILAILHAVTLTGICVGLSGLAVGLGALYINLKEDNPSKIVSGFGGTLNLVLSWGFTVLVIAVQYIPCHYFFTRHMLTAELFHLYVLIAIGLVIIISFVTSIIPMLIGLHAFRRLEI